MRLLQNIQRHILIAVISLATIPVALSTPSNTSTQKLYTLDEAISHGVVDINFNPWAIRKIDPLIAHIAEVNPGLINRLGFHYGGQSSTYLNAVTEIIAKIRMLLPRTLVGGGFNEAIYRDYNQTLQCGGDLKQQTFTRIELASNTSLGTNAFFVDMSKPRVQAFYICVGQILIDGGVTYLHFEAPSLLLRASSSSDAAINNYRNVQTALRKYAFRRGVNIYFSGDPDLAQKIKLEGVYMPSRFYHVTIPKFVRYQNRIPEPGVGVGYSYALSPNIIHDTLAATPPETKTFFYVDNWDESQDDLRRLMELDAKNRHTLFQASSAAAAKAGAYFIPPLVLCQGCVLPPHVGDACEIVDGVSEYDAYACGDLKAIRLSLDAQIGH